MTPIEASELCSRIADAYPAWKPTPGTVRIYALAWVDAPLVPMLEALVAWVRSAHPFPPAAGELLALAGLADPEHREPLPPYLAKPWGSLEPHEWVDRARARLEDARARGDSGAVMHWASTLRRREAEVAKHAPGAIGAGGAQLLRSFGFVSGPDIGGRGPRRLGP